MILIITKMYNRNKEKIKMEDEIDRELIKEQVGKAILLFFNTCKKHQLVI